MNACVSWMNYDIKMIQTDPNTSPLYALKDKQKVYY